MLNKVTLSTGKILLVRNMEIEDYERSVEIASARGGSNAMLTTMLMQKELVKMLTMSVDGKKLSPTERETLIKTFSISEYGQISKVIESMMGTKEDPKVELVSDSGEK